jgi:FkbM family methyltransferase
MSLDLRKLAKETLKRFDRSLTRYSYLERLEVRSKVFDNIDVLLALPENHSAQLLKVLRNSSSQLGQDLFVLSEVNFKKHGYFVEFGATDGVSGSNTWLLEKEFSWNGILSEPAKRWHQSLFGNRTCNIETNCVWRESNQTITFNETEWGELSTIDVFSSSDYREQERKRGRKYDVKTLSLEDLLNKYHAPREIDYLSIDTEGSEYEILKSFDFEKYRIRIITCEHNFTPQRDKVFELLAGKGYERKLESISKVDDWYVRSE